MVKLVDTPPFFRIKFGDVVELVDTHGSGPCGSNVVRVQVSPSPPDVYIIKKGGAGSAFRALWEQSRVGSTPTIGTTSLIINKILLIL